MEVVSEARPAVHARRRMWIAMAGVLLVALVAGVWIWRATGAGTAFFQQN